ncbi:hypothetical protein DOK78_000084 [Enterococcus sp. DIV2402]|uniref:DUF536 domain-containing protein n=1 Tax=Candidatus Enterococcus lowellii TaxID=2230877 RepID=A0ABZ2SHY0_9ENTE|nr:DNA-binding protein [Enterococcus sp. DIV2402]MBO0463113.1 DNA-binding protein [Enterococcus sp. DIV2402]
MEMTIKQLADELGVNKRKIIYRVKKLPHNLYTKRNNVVYITEEGIKKITDEISKNMSSTQKSDNDTEKKNDYEKSLIEQLEIKDQQIRILQNALETQQKLLDQQQQLSAEDKIVIKELQSQIALNEPMKEYYSIHENNNDKKNKEIRKWYQFWIHKTNN